MPSVTLNHVSYDRIVRYADATGQTVSEVANKAINEWMDITGDTTLEVLEKRQEERMKKMKQKDNGQLLTFRPNASRKPAS